MERRDVDIVVIGSGFAGTLLAMILTRIGRSVLVIDRATHPRFAIGESSTPTANLVLGDLVQMYQLKSIEPLVHHGSWQSHYPQVGCGLKRGFSYYKHRPGEAFRVTADHQDEMMVAASTSDEMGDTHWLRADLDAFLARQLEQMGGELWEQSEVKLTGQDRSGDAWQLEVESGTERRLVKARFLVDASGAGQWLAGSLQLKDVTHRLRTHSQAIFSHFHGVASWHELLTTLGATTDDHPFYCDHAAQHHLLEGAWMWILGFHGGLTSAGIAFDPRQHSSDRSWQVWLDQYPSLAQIFSDARLADQPGKYIQSGRLQRHVTPASGPGWALLPHTAAFVDPLHSTGIAHSLCAIEQLAGILQQHWNRDSLTPQLAGYARRLEREIDLVDRLVAGCYQGLSHVELFRSFSMLYFAAATNYERARMGTARPGLEFLCAEDESFSLLVDSMLDEVGQLAGKTDLSPQEINSFRDTLANAIQPFNHVGLCDLSSQQMYSHTVTIPTAPTG